MYNLDMLHHRKELLDFAYKFTKLCDFEGIWYSLDKETLKGSRKHGGFVPWQEHFDVMITLDGYQKLSRLHPHNIVDSYVDKRYKKLTVVFVANNKDWLSPQPFINIRVLIPTTTAKIKKFSSIFYQAKNIIRFRFDNIKHAINDLIDHQRYEGYYLLEKRQHFTKLSWIQTMSMQTEIVNFAGLEVKIVKEYDAILKYWYGDNYLAPSVVPSIWYSYISPQVKERGSK